ncbi:division/cell wall cluster transcriptional repressor MraZ [Aureimonas leprariae]|uniref:Transcriptional regulator MraZ n=1 Tax=Plantimonas leprariae TaxID=2615207 RepID=A0A7V7PQW0_9HYPH|nr:division/cell wall cluster transcriptional repressor MraZ [Aureimonas leprariae]KAB0680817.1 division/cell wall cluster transcriptional repressor MraZ [Aureimonas leprariae]
MDRFLSNSVLGIDAKGRVSIPSGFRQVMAARGFRDFYGMQSLGDPAIDVGGSDLLERYESRMSAEDPLGETYADLSLLAYGDGTFLKVDPEGRITVTDFIRSHTGIADRVAFVGRNQFFQLWEPDRFEAHRAEARARLLAARKSGSGRVE